MKLRRNRTTDESPRCLTCGRARNEGESLDAWHRVSRNGEPERECGRCWNRAHSDGAVAMPPPPERVRSEPTWQDEARARAAAKPQPQVGRSTPKPPDPHSFTGACVLCGVAEPSDAAFRVVQAKLGPAIPRVTGPYCGTCYRGVERYDFDTATYVAVSLDKLPEAVRFGDTWAGHVLDGRQRGLLDAVPNDRPWQHVKASSGA